jgi:hypothetical protein
MGYLTVICVHNDEMSQYQKDPKLFGETMLQQMGKADLYNEPSKFRGITAFPPRHANDKTVYVSAGNFLCEVTYFAKDFRNLLERMPKIAMDTIKAAEDVIKDAKQFLTKKTKSS